jgi:uncharacterized membrane protein YgcG
MKLLAATAALVVAVVAGLGPAQARDSYVIDNAQLLAPATVSAINSKVGDFNAQTHKEVVVVVDPSFTGTAAAAEERTFAQQQVNGVLIYIAKSPKTIAVVPDRAAAHYFPAGTTSAIRQAIASAFNSGDFNGGVTNGVDLTLAQYRSHLGSLRSSVPTYNNAPTTAYRAQTGGGFSMSWIMWLIAFAVIFFVVRGIFRAIAGPRMYPPGYGGGQMGPMGGMGGGYGPGYGGGGFGGGGGGFWSGMLGGLGGAFLGNELFGGNREFGGGQQAGFGGDGGQGQYGGGDSSGFQNDAGQADMGNASSGGWGGDSGGGGGGWGDTGGGGGDFGGGGGGDGGGGW